MGLDYEILSADLVISLVKRISPHLPEIRADDRLDRQLDSLDLLELVIAVEQATNMTIIGACPEVC